MDRPRRKGGSTSPENDSPVEDSPWRARTDGKKLSRFRREIRARQARDFSQRVEDNAFHLGQVSALKIARSVFRALKK
jgi:hypothetical protein